MCDLFLTLLLSGVVKAPVTKPDYALTARAISCERRLSPVILLADGGADWPGEAASRIAEELKADLEPCCPLEVARFDAKPMLHTRFAVNGSNRDLVMVAPRTPMREAMEAGLASLMNTPGPRTMVVIAHGQSCPTGVSEGRLLELARYSRTTVHTIHLAPARSGLFQRLGRSLGNEVVRGVEALGLRERAESARETATLLKAMADATGGKACITTGQPAGIDCAKEVAAEILGSARY